MKWFKLLGLLVALVLLEVSLSHRLSLSTSCETKNEVYWEKVTGRYLGEISESMKIVGAQ